MSAPEFAPFLAASRWIDWQQPAVRAQASQLAAGLNDDAAIAAACFAFVRDEIRHSADYRCNPVTCAASAALAAGTGYCYAKSHLLAALLRANGIPAGLCYQRLTIDGTQPPYCLHGLNAVHLRRHGWYRIDARGNKPGVSAAFTPPQECLAFPIRYPDEADLPGIHAEPLPEIVEVLTTAPTWDAVLAQLPDRPAAGRR